MTEKPATFAVFVYGTLRPGQGLYPVIEPALIAPPIDAIVHGYELYANRSASFPYMVAGTGEVHGTLMLCDDGPALQEVAQIELSSGYELQAMPVRFSLNGTERVVPGVGFVLPPSGFRRCGEPIPGGDWIEWREQRLHRMFARSEIETIPAKPL